MRPGSSLKHRKFVSFNHIMFYERQTKGKISFYIPRYAGKSGLDRWIVQNGGEISINNYQNLWTGKIKLKNVRYNLMVLYENQRAFENKDERNIEKIISCGDTMLCDEVLTLGWRHKVNPCPELLEEIKRLGFREV